MTALVALVIRQQLLLGEQHFILHFKGNINTHIHIALVLLQLINTVFPTLLSFGLQSVLLLIGVTVNIKQCFPLVLASEPHHLIQLDTHRRWSSISI